MNNEKNLDIDVFMMWVYALDGETKAINDHAGTNYTAPEVFAALDCALTEKGLLERFLAYYGYHYRYDRRNGVWFQVGERPNDSRYRWVVVHEQAVREGIVDVVRSVYREPRLVVAAKNAGIVSYVREGRDQDCRNYSVDMNNVQKVERILRLAKNILTVPNEGLLPKIRTKGKLADVWLEPRKITPKEAA